MGLGEILLVIGLGIVAILVLLDLFIGGPGHYGHHEWHCYHQQPPQRAGRSDFATGALGDKQAGQTYYFCSPGCKKSFDKEPEKYAGKAQPQAHGDHH